MKHINTLQPMLADQSQPQYEDEYAGVPRDYPEPCTEENCGDWTDKIKDFRPSYQGGGGGGGGATMIFKVSESNPSHLVPLVIAGGGGGMADLPSDNNPDSTRLYHQDQVNLQGVVSEIEAAALVDPLIRSISEPNIFTLKI